MFLRCNRDTGKSGRRERIRSMLSPCAVFAAMTTGAPRCTDDLVVAGIVTVLNLLFLVSVLLAIAIEWWQPEGHLGRTAISINCGSTQIL